MIPGFLEHPNANKSMVWFLCWLSLSCILSISRVDGHGRMVNPPARNTMWRSRFSNPVNYNDDELFCGGITHQWSLNNGKCGICGDSFDLSTPRPHEMGGHYGNGIIVETYTPGQAIDVKVILSTNHKGWMEWRICEYNDVKKEVTQKCLDEGLLPMADSYETRFVIPHGSPNSNYTIDVKLKLPERFTCKNCVMQWHYYTGNFWGSCENGTQATGCGQQETYRNCADISIGYYYSETPWYQFLANPSTYYDDDQDSMHYFNDPWKLIYRN